MRADIVRFCFLVLTYGLLVLCVCCHQHDPREDPERHVIGPSWVRSVHNGSVTIETEQGYISRWDFCYPQLVWQGMHAQFVMSKNRGFDPCFNAEVHHLPPDLKQ
jgi:hypothetical protein